ncbi:MAG: ring-cleaving dioxygenase [Armatimonadota bacterium]|nr:ring-cleaving dioxygenase [Armatimonadota bacterium]MDR7437772.1 ring-cleaving dioxygenase [Armatimonadota bacterium]MDR7506526.1 ring-cleaving dioxygenase [Armatimonadota bacterium]MDR7517892.1 ring-cleaving dioxygenase [Armatimonadota bacterium]MDR7583935.1 ring-cleaving dioxygenase [Armatimonadota bacterium]
MGPSRPLGGVHHVTAICGHPQENVDFYVGVLGLRLVKRSVNQDDPGTYHLFYADAVGTPGTDLTFFAWPGGPRGRVGAGQAAAVALAVPPGALPFWSDRLRSRGLDVRGPVRRFDEHVLTLTDPHGQVVELVGAPDAADRPWVFWEDGPIPREHAVRGIHSVTLTEAAAVPTVPFLTERLGFRPVASEGNRTRYAVGPGGSGAWLDLVVDPGAPAGRVAVGTIHHVAWRTPTDDDQRSWWEAIRRLGVPVSDIIDRFWFHSIYFREPGGVLFEIATDGPGFAVDEAVHELGSRLVLPPWLEPRRAEIERALIPLALPPITRPAQAGAP